MVSISNYPLKQFFGREIENFRKYRVEPLRILYAWRHGFSIRDAALLSLSPPNEYLSSLQQMKYIPPEPEHIDQIEDKSQFYRNTPDELIPETYFDLTSVPQEFDGIAKPVDGIAGRGVRRFHREGDQMKIDGAADIVRDDGSVDFDGYIFQERIKQHDYSQGINPYSVNTLRLLTINPEWSEEPYVASAVHRFGSSDTAPTDNWSRGGCAAPVDVNSGTLGPVHFLENGEVMLSNLHPESKSKIEDTSIPNWGEVLVTARRIAEFYSELSYVGWDIVIKEDGQPVVVEGNSKPHLALQQLGDGLLSDPTVRSYFTQLEPKSTVYEYVG